MLVAVGIVHFVFLLVHLCGTFGEEAVLNEYIDTVLGNAQKKGFQITSLSLPDISKNVAQTSAINLFKSYQITNGKVDKLQELVRSKTAILNYTGSEAELNAGFSFTDLQVTYDFKVQGAYEFLSLSGSLDGRVQQMNISFDVSANTKTLQLEAKSLNFESPGKISLQLTTSKVTQWIMNALLDFSTTHFESEILSAVRNAIMNAINSVSDAKTQLLRIIQ